jgi:hypothetical protein
VQGAPYSTIPPPRALDARALPLLRRQIAQKFGRRRVRLRVFAPLPGRYNKMPGAVEIDPTKLLAADLNEGHRRLRAVGIALWVVRSRIGSGHAQKVGMSIGAQN